jgi:assimilatory nitrate reductase catalytic subunit
MMLRRDGDSISVAARDFPTNKGGLCRKGWTSAELLDAPDRLTSPMIRRDKGGALLPANWDEALDRIAEEVTRISGMYGPDAIGVFGGGALTNEKAYLLGKFARLAIGTANIDYNGRFCMSSAAAAGLQAFGLDRGLPFPLEDIPGSEAILLAGANPAETMPPIMQYFEMQQRRGGQLIVADPRRTPTAEAAALHLQLAPGTDAALANGLLNIAIRDGLIDRDFIDARTSGFEEVRRVAASYWPDRVERITGITESKLRQAARILGTAKSAMLLSARGPEQQSHGVNNVLAYINLILALGHAGKPHAGYGSLTGQGNGQGGREHGQKCDQLPGYRKLDNPAHRKEVAAAWGVDPQSLPKPGQPACELIDLMGREGGVRALLIFGSNLIVSSPDASWAKTRLSSLDLLVVADPFLSETAAIADIVLPTAQWAEENGSMTNLEGRVILRRAAREPPTGVKTDLQIMNLLASRLGGSHRFSDEPETVFKELGQVTSGAPADYAGITYDRIESANGIFWPCPGADHPGTPRLFQESFHTDDGRAKFHAIEYSVPAEEPDGDFPFYLTTGRVLAHYQSGTQTRRVQSLVEAEPEPFAQIHPDMARMAGIAQGELIRIVSRRGEAILRTRFDASMRLDTIFAPFHWPREGSANLLTNNAADPVSGIPEFKVCAVRLEKVPST